MKPERILLLVIFLTSYSVTFSENTPTPLPLDVDRYDNSPQTIYHTLAPGDSLPRVILPDGYAAFVHATGLSSPDGLALSPGGVLYVAEESAGRVSAVAEDGTVTPFATGITSPEGIAFDTDGNLYVVEDAENGRVLCFDTLGAQTVIATNRDAPEGVTVEADGSVLITESNVQFVSSPFLYETHVTRIPSGGAPSNLNTGLLLWSYSGITTDATGTVYVCNEASGTGTTNSVFSIDPSSGTRTLFCSGLIACEGLRFSPGGAFPLYVAEEDLGDADGRLSSVNSSGTASTFATGLYRIEDVLVDPEGRIFITEDATGMIIRIEDTTSIGIAETKAPTQMELIAYPNPFNANLQIEIAGLAPLDPEGYLIWVKIFDINGRLVYCWGGSDESTIQSSNSPTIQARFSWHPDESIQSGTYLVRATVGNVISQIKIIYLK
ncbi:T9SS type A sorting domain-containing protein [bacterium]|nr:T9SS type A sorting domain-containing protein [bacterium]